jgi:signal peptidase II
VKYRYAILIVLLVIIADQWSKFYIKTHFYYGEEINVIGTWFRLHFLENEGMAFGMKLSQSDIGKLLLTLFRLAAVIVGFFLLKRLVRKGYTKGAIICGALILAGALGNLIDSIFYGMIFTDSSFHVAKLVPWGQGYGKLLHGRVVDMLYFPIFSVKIPGGFPLIGGKQFEFFEPVFNIADAAISVGVLTLVFFQKRLVHKREVPVVQGGTPGVHDTGEKPVLIQNGDDQ